MAQKISKLRSPDILFILPSLAMGGAERNLVQIANALHAKGRYVAFLTLCSHGEFRAELNPEIEYACLGKSRVLSSLLPLIMHLLKLKPKAILSSLFHCNFLVFLAALLTKNLSRLTIREADTPSVLLEGLHGGKKLHFRLSYFLFKLVERKICVSDGVKLDLETNFGFSTQLVKIANPIDLSLLCARSTEVDHSPVNELAKLGYTVILAIGRLEPQKGFDVLLSSFSLLAPKNEKLVLVILGEGSQRKFLERLVENFGLAARVFMPGFVSNPFPALARCEVFVLSSRNEGMPSVLLQALALGRKIVSTNCKSGPSEVLNNGEYGMLVPVDNAHALAEAIGKQCDTLENIGNKKLSKYLEKFGINEIAESYERVLFRNDRICYLATCMGYGGAEKQVATLANHFSKTRKVFVVSLTNEIGIAEDFLNSKVYFTAMNMKKGKASLIAILRFSSFLKKNRIRVVHSHMIHANIFAGIAKLLNPKVRLICTAHSVFEGGKFLELVFKCTSRLANCCTHVSVEGFNRYIRLGLFSKTSSTVVPNAIDHAEIDKKNVFFNPNSSDNIFKIVMVARFFEVKNHRTAIAAICELIRQKMPVELHLFGSGPLERAIKEQVKLVGVSEFVFFQGKSSKIGSIIKDYDCFLNCSLYEGLPISCLEAISAGLLLLAPRVGEMPSILSGTPELLIEETTVHEIVVKVKSLIENYREIPALSSALRSKGDVYSIKSISLVWESLYQTSN